MGSGLCLFDENSKIIFKLSKTDYEPNLNDKKCCSNVSQFIHHKDFRSDYHQHIFESKLI